MVKDFSEMQQSNSYSSMKATKCGKKSIPNSKNWQTPLFQWTWRTLGCEPISVQSTRIMYDNRKRNTLNQHSRSYCNSNLNKAAFLHLQSRYYCALWTPWRGSWTPTWSSLADFPDTLPPNLSGELLWVIWIQAYMCNGIWEGVSLLLLLFGAEWWTHSVCFL